MLRQSSIDRFIRILEENVTHGQRKVAQYLVLALFNRHINFYKTLVVLLTGERLEISIKLLIATVKPLTVVALFQKLNLDFRQMFITRPSWC